MRQVLTVTECCQRAIECALGLLDDRAIADTVANVRQTWKLCFGLDANQENCPVLMLLHLVRSVRENGATCRGSDSIEIQRLIDECSAIMDAEETGYH